MSERHDAFDGVPELYVVGGLPDAEVRAFERHLSTCESCSADVSRLRETVAALSVPNSTLPAGLRDKVFASVDAEIAGTAQAPAADAAASNLPASNVVELPDRRRRPPAWLAAACAVVLGIGAAVLIWRAVAPSPPPAPVAASQVVASVMAAPDMTKSTGTRDGATVAAMYAPSQRATVVATLGLPAVPANMMYQVWITVGGETKSAGMVPGGRPDKTMVVMTGMGRPSAIGVSMEPAAGSSAPTSPMLVEFPVR
ncbi:anti-sigma factor [Gordonia sp. TBRC 11910]|uniref:Regulator of SigK n=1 Tax=Gordonia asplenii TaxID=2725283 RepID=A0A848KSR7_9ACTN|nr:anti-sigma factor [Gordonia asplenii]NMO01047.1 anti-sigma factor [Gordonia asplenii]